MCLKSTTCFFKISLSHINVSNRMEKINPPYPLSIRGKPFESRYFNKEQYLAQKRQRAAIKSPQPCLQPCHPECARSHLISEAK